MCHYTHFTTEERELSRVLKALGFSIRAIARMLNRNPSSVSRELRRNVKPDGTYSANYADKLYHQRRKKCGRKPLLQQLAVYMYVIERLNEYWSPEQIAGRAKVDKMPFSISYNTIYRAIASGLLPKQLKKKLRIKSHYKKPKGNDRRGKIADTVPITERPAGADNRTRFGHWESDTFAGKRNTGCLGTHVERKSGYLVAFRIDSRADKAFNQATIQAFKDIPDNLKKSFTVDNGIEFAAHKELAEATNMKVFFCAPYSPWQRGTNENTNGLLRQFFPKGSSFEDITSDQLAKVVELINNRPRKRLGFRSPAEVIKKFLK